LKRQRILSPHGQIFLRLIGRRGAGSFTEQESSGPTLSPNSFHEKAGRGQDTLRFFLSVSLFPFS
jgi:hypothetical protein